MKKSLIFSFFVFVAIALSGCPAKDITVTADIYNSAGQLVHQDVPVTNLMTLESSGGVILRVCGPNQDFDLVLDPDPAMAKTYEHDDLWLLLPGAALWVVLTDVEWQSIWDSLFNGENQECRYYPVPITPAVETATVTITSNEGMLVFYISNPEFDGEGEGECDQTVKGLINITLTETEAYVDVDTRFNSCTDELFVDTRPGQEFERIGVMICPPDENTCRQEVREYPRGNLRINLLQPFGNEQSGNLYVFALDFDQANTNEEFGRYFAYLPNWIITVNGQFVDTPADGMIPLTRPSSPPPPPVDTTPPVITLNGANPLTITVGTTFVDPGATATDNVDGNVAVTASGTINVNVAGTYTRTYTAIDSAGNTATRTRTVVVQTQTPPPPPPVGDVGVFFTGTGQARTMNLCVGNYSPAQIVADGLIPAGTTWSQVRQVRLTFWKVPSPVWCLHQTAGFSLDSQNCGTITFDRSGSDCNGNTATLPTGTTIVEAIPYLIVDGVSAPVPINTGLIVGYQDGTRLSTHDGNYLLDVSGL